ncbi:MAG TPA: hypothetical protein VFB52_13710 [Solirubrobacterales bacterium]|nr:hypothetical protein [Solirubrobacterales bacterium]
MKRISLVIVLAAALLTALVATSQAEVEATPASVDLGAIDYGQQPLGVKVNFKLTADETHRQFVSLGLGGDAAAFKFVDDCAAMLGGGSDNCTAYVAVAETASPGLHQGTLSLVLKDPGGAQITKTVGLSVTVGPAPQPPPSSPDRTHKDKDRGRGPDKGSSKGKAKGKKGCGKGKAKAKGAKGKKRCGKAKGKKGHRA